MTNFGGNTVTPIPLGAASADSAIASGAGPYGIAITPNGTTAYVVNRCGSDTLCNSLHSSVTPLNLTTGTIGAAIPVGYDALGIAITPNGKTAYVVNRCGADPACAGNGTVTPINVATGTAGAPISVGVSPEGIAITPNGQTALVTNQCGSDESCSLSSPGSVTPIALSAKTAAASITVGRQPAAIAVTPNGKSAYVVNECGDDSSCSQGSVTPIDLATGTAGPSIGVGGLPTGIAITPNGSTAYVVDDCEPGPSCSADGPGSVTPISLASNQPGGPFDVSERPFAISITPAGDEAYVTGSGDASVTPFAVASNTPSSTIAVGANPEGIAITPDQSPTARFRAAVKPHHHPYVRRSKEKARAEIGRWLINDSVRVVLVCRQEPGRWEPPRKVIEQPGSSE